MFPIIAILFFGLCCFLVWSFLRFKLVVDLAGFCAFQRDKCEEYLAFRRDISADMEMLPDIKNLLPQVRELRVLETEDIFMQEMSFFKRMDHHFKIREVIRSLINAPVENPELEKYEAFLEIRDDFILLISEMDTTLREYNKAARKHNHLIRFGIYRIYSQFLDMEPIPLLGRD